MPDSVVVLARICSGLPEWAISTEPFGKAPGFTKSRALRITVPFAGIATVVAPANAPFRPRQVTTTPASGVLEVLRINEKAL